VSRFLGDVAESRTHPAIQAMQDGSGGMGGVVSLFAENAGMTIERKDNKAPIYIKPALNTFSQHVEIALRIVHMADDVRIADAITRNDDLAKAITDRYGVAVYNSLRQYLVEATGMSEPNTGPVDRWLRNLSSNLAASYISANPGTMLIQFTGIPRLLGRISFRDYFSGIAWAERAALNGTLGPTLEQSGFFQDRWSRSTITRFGPQKYGEMVPMDVGGFNKGVGRALKSLATRDLKGAARSWSSAIQSIQFLDAIDRYIVGISYGASLSRAKRESPLLNESQLHERALEYAEDDIRETQNSSSRLDYSVAASSWRQSWVGQAWLMFSSDPFAFINRVTWAQAQYRKGNSKEGARALAGALTSFAMEAPVRTAYWAGITYLLASIFADDDDRKKAERLKKTKEVWWANVLRSIAGVSPILGGAIETVASTFTDVFYSDSFMSSAVGDAANEIGRGGGRIVNELGKISDEEADASIEVILINTGKLVNQLASLFAGNPVHPIASKVLRGWEGNANEAISDIKGLDRYYDGQEKDDAFISEEQRQYALDVKDLARRIRSTSRDNPGINALKKELKEWEADKRDGKSVDSKIEEVEALIKAFETEALEMLQRSGPDYEPVED